ncbi:hypothetical protein [Fulvivirga kasyanovii]|uniref:Uncharacterized protein n=1 Tax=Fulvivirga kasyanovii TaxID=396812 RepID=A0ABW9RJZ2_9BACT|nr:hypothetical protein [Fulvivirga kasyanovii]MTI24399.1 hypothetical protein [Fulvivirga kasyanovii]
MKVLGWGRATRWTIFGTKYSTRFIYSGTPENWKKLLATLDSDSAFNDYLLPFFAATGVVNTGSVKNYFGVNTKYLENYEFKDARPGKRDILNLLRALYDTDSSTKSKMNLPDKFSEGTSNIPLHYDSGFNGLAAFIAKYQHLLIQYKSGVDIKDEDDNVIEKESGVALQYEDTKALATQGTRWSDPQVGNPRVAKAMIENAFATAIAATKLAINLEGETGPNKNSDQNKALYMVENSAMIIKSALDSYGNLVAVTNKNISSIFNEVWGLIPLPDIFPAPVEKRAKNLLSEKILDRFKVGGEFKDIGSLKECYKQQYRDILDALAKMNDLEFEANAALSSSFNSRLGN